MPRRPFPGVLVWFLCVTFGLAFILVAVSSPDHGNDPLFWLIAGGVVGLAVLSVLLRNEKDEDARDGFIRLFFLGGWLFGILMAACAIWQRVESGAFWGRR
jgi:drug/metabolite transporter (DMT)-like permease